MYVSYSILKMIVCRFQRLVGVSRFSHSGHCCYCCEGNCMPLIKYSGLRLEVMAVLVPTVFDQSLCEYEDILK